MDRSNIVFFGDSDTAGYMLEDTRNRFAAITADSLDLDECNGAEAGAGFCVQDNYIIDQVLSSVRTMSDAEKSDTKYVIILGGWNDYTSMEAYGITEEAEVNAISEVIEQCMTTFPDAKICFGCGIYDSSLGTGYDEWISDINQMIGQIYPTVYVFEGFGENVPMESDYYGDDMQHMNEKGHELLSRWLLEEILKIA